MRIDILDPIPYLRTPRLSVRSGLSLGRILLTRVPGEAGPGVVAAAHTLASATDELEEQWKARQQPSETTSARPQDRQLDQAWTIIEAGLARYSLFEADEPDRVRAAEIYQRLFPEGLAFIRLPFIEQHAECSRRLDLIEDEGLRNDLERLVGPAFIHQMLVAHDAYGEALGITREDPATPPAVSLRQPLRDLAGAISSYALQVLAYAGLHQDNVATARHALDPIDALRRAIMRRSADRGRSEPAPEDVLSPDRAEQPASNATTADDVSAVA